MRTIAVIGASGQVGVELCLFLQVRPEVRVVALCRSDLGASFLRRCGVNCRVGDLASPREASRLLEGCDLIFDLSLPKGLVHEIRSATNRTIRSAIRGSSAKCHFVFASTFMALGPRMVAGAPLRHHLLAQTSYGANKRVAERTAFREGRLAGRQVSVLRLGQVHGEMQSISRQILRRIDGRPTVAPELPSNTVFVFTIAEALAHLADGLERPGLYTLVSTPQWSWKDIHGYYASRSRVSATIAAQQERTSSGERSAAQLFRWFVSRSLSAAAHQREFLNGYVLHRVVALEWWAKARWLLRGANDQITQRRACEVNDLYGFAFSGDAPGRRLRTLSDSRRTMGPSAEHVREILRSAEP